VIATRTKVDLSGFKVPDHINDTYFKRPKKKQTKRAEGDIFAKKEEKYVPSEQRKKDQVEVDKSLKVCIKKTYRIIYVAKIFEVAVCFEIQPISTPYVILSEL